MTQPTRDSLFEEAAKGLRTRFEEIKSSVPHNLEKGMEIEDVVKIFLRDYLPRRYDITGGFIIDRENNISSQQDVIIYDAFHCPIYRPGSRGAVVPIDNVASVFEVKSELDINNFRETLTKIHKLRKLQKSPDQSAYPNYPAQLSHTYCVIFAFNSKISTSKVFEVWKEQIKVDDSDIFRSCSLIVIPDKGIFTTCAYIPGEGIAPANFGGAPPAPVGTKVGVNYFEAKEKTLDSMMRLLIGHLTFFWWRVHHPGFNFSQFGQSPVSWFQEVK